MTANADQTAPVRLHHHAWVCKDPEVTRHFYEDIIGMPLIATWCEEMARPDGSLFPYCHMFFGMPDGSALAFFAYADEAEYEQRRGLPQSTAFHVALAVGQPEQDALRARLEAASVPVRMIDHGYCQSLYLSDPDGLRLEFTADVPEVDKIADIRSRSAHADLARWLSGDHRPNNDWRAEH